jgi:aquaporin Z
VVLTFAFLWIITGATDKRAPAGFAPILGGILGASAYRALMEE